ncbi:MAG: glycosyltransferase family A protein [Azospirillaceae bacterium]
MAREQPLGVVIPAFEAAETIAATLESLLPLARHIAGIVVSDDGSSDGTAEVARAWAAAHALPLQVVAGANAGPGVARDRGLDAVTGDWVLFLDADDRVLPDGLSRLIETALAAAPDRVAIAGGYEEVIAGGERRSRLPATAETIDVVRAPGRLADWIHRRGPAIHLGATLIRRDRLVRPAFPESRVGEDRAALAALFLAGPVDVLPVAALAYRLDVGRQWRREATAADDLLRSAAFVARHLGASALDPRLAARLARAVEADALLTAMRACAKAGERRRARALWRRAVRLAPATALRWRHLRRAL